MQNGVFRVLFVPVFALWEAAVSGGEMPKQFTIAIPDYGSGQTDEKVLDKQTEAILETHRDLVAELTGQLRSKTLSNASRVYIVYLLGELRPADPSAITLLIENVDLVAEKTDLRIRPPRWSSHPAEEALAKIGRRASDMILHIIGSSKFDPGKASSYARVLVDVEESKYALMRLTDRLAETKDEEVRKQYEMVMARVQIYIRPPQ